MVEVSTNPDYKGRWVREFVLTPTDYLRYGDKPIQNLPLINTSLKGLASVGWYLSVHARYIRGYGYSKVRYQFCDPDRNGNPFIIFKLWAKGDVFGTHDETEERLLKEFVARDLTPNFTKPPSFGLMPLSAGPLKCKACEEREYQVQETELEYLIRTNEEKKMALRRDCTHVETRDDYNFDEIPFSQELLVG